MTWKPTGNPNDPVQFDGDGNPFLFTPGDMGIPRTYNVLGYRNAQTGEPITQTTYDGGFFTGGFDAGGRPFLKKGVTDLPASAVPNSVPWPKGAGDDPR